MRSVSEIAARARAWSASVRSSFAYSRFCQSGIATAASASATSSASGSQNCQRVQTLLRVRSSGGSRLRRDVAAAAGGSGTTAATSHPQAATCLSAGSSDGAAHGRQIDGDRSARGVALGDDRVEVEFLGLERRVPVEVVRERLLHVLLDGGRQHHLLAQHVARRHTHDDAPGAGGPAVDHARGRRERGAAGGGDAGGVARQRDRRRRRHRGAAAFDRRTPQRRVVALEDDDRAHAAALERRARRGRHERIELPRAHHRQKPDTPSRRAASCMRAENRGNVSSRSAIGESAVLWSGGRVRARARRARAP